MLLFLYCNVATIKCTQNDFEDIIKTNAVSSIKIDDCSWIIEIHKTNFDSLLGAEEDFYNSIIKPLATHKSIIAISEITNRFDGNLPQPVTDFISEKLKNHLA